MALNKEELENIKSLLSSPDINNRKLAMILAFDSLKMSYTEFVDKFLKFDLDDIIRKLENANYFISSVFNNYRVHIKFMYYDTKNWLRVDVFHNEVIIINNYCFTKPSLENELIKCLVFIIKRIHQE